MSAISDLPNAYGDLVQAASALTGTELNDKEVDEISNEELDDFVAANEVHLDAARSALERGCRTPLAYDTEYFERQQLNYASLRRLTYGFVYELVAAKRSGRTDLATVRGVDLQILASSVRKNGLVIDLLVSNGISGVGVDRMRRIRHSLSPGDAKFLAHELWQIEQDREPFDTVIARDTDWEQRVGGNEEEELPPDLDIFDDSDEVDHEMAQVIEQAMREVFALPPSELHEMQRQLDNESLVVLRLLEIELAVQAFHGRHHSYPDQLDELCPEILPVVASNPFTDGPFVYRRRAGQTPLIYAVGPSGKDLGGSFGDWFAARGGLADICLDIGDFAFT